MSERKPLVFQASLVDTELLPFGLQEVEQVQLLLRGGSVIDWRRLSCRDLGHADSILKVLGFDFDEPTDRLRLEAIHAHAVTYLERTFDRTLLDGVRDPEDPRDLLLLASQPGPAQRDACSALKVMHVVHHAEGRELLSRLPVASKEIFHRIETRVYEALDGLKIAGVKVVEFTGSRKSSDSILTKLLSRTDSLASEVHDKLRFRVVTENLGDIFGALAFLSTHLFPFNYVIPGASRNDLIDLRATLANDPHLSAHIPMLQSPSLDSTRGSGAQSNAFSSPDFNMINFVVDMPVRIDDLTDALPDYDPVEDGSVVFELVEFQLVDQATAVANASGLNRHDLYKRRQHMRVLERLHGGRG